MQYSLLSTNIF